MIPFEIPARYISRVASGELIRYGSILKDANTGMVVGHLKEAGNLALSLSTLNPINVLSQIVQHYQLHQIQKTLETLQIISSVGAISSVATFGICVVGFSVINNKLKLINSKLDQVLHKIDAIREIVDRMDIKWDSLNKSKLQAACEQLSIAQNTESLKRRRDLLERSCHTFGEFESYYLNILESNDVWTDGEIPIENAVELYSRLITCSLGQLYSEFFLGDMSSFVSRWELSNQKVVRISKFDRVDAYRSRTDQNARDPFLMSTTDFPQLASEVKEAHSIASETCARIDTMVYEADYIEKSGISPVEYIRQINNMPPDIILIPVPR